MVRREEKDFTIISRNKLIFIFNTYYFYLWKCYNELIGYDF